MRAKSSLALALSLAISLVGRLQGQDMPLSQVLLPDEPWREVRGDFQSAGGLACGPGGEVFLVDPTGKAIWRIGATGKPGLFVRTSAAVAGLAVGADGKVYACQPRAARLVTWSQPDKEVVLWSGHAVHDVIVTGQGNCYSTVPDEKAVYLVRADGSSLKLDRGLPAPAGITLWPDGGTLVVGNSAGRRLYAYRVETDGALTAREGYYTLRGHGVEPSGVAGLVCDEARRLYAATRDGVQVFDPTGRMSGVLSRPLREPTTALTIGGPARDHLFCVCGSKLFVRKIAARGVK